MCPSEITVKNSAGTSGDALTPRPSLHPRSPDCAPAADRRASAALEADPAPSAQGGESGVGEGGKGPALPPAAWILEYDNGSIGMLHTRDDARRRGYGRAVARSLAAELAAAHARGARGAPPFCFVAEDNSASRHLFEGLGFAARGTVAWVRFPPPSADRPPP